MKELVQFIIDHTTRGECQCGKCCDKGPDRPAPKHSVSVHFFWVSVKGEPTKDRLVELLRANYPRLDRLQGGPSYIEIGGELGDQQVGLRLIGLGKLVGLWECITPATLGIDGPDAEVMAGNGFVMAGGCEI